MKGFNEKICPRCGAPKMKRWEEFTGEEKFLIEKLPASKDFTPAERKRHRFCPRCWFEAFDHPPQIV